ncbi:MAG: glycoside hydrolase family 15 protein [Candidatus Binatia bacterium]
MDDVHPTENAYPPLTEYALIGDCHSAALVSRSGSIDWCCLPRFDSDPCFSRLLDWQTGGYFRVAPVARQYAVSRQYLDNTLVLETRFRTSGGSCRLLDCFTMRPGGKDNPHRQLLRIIEGLDGLVEVTIELAPRFDFGKTRPWLRSHGPQVWCAFGSSHALGIVTDYDMQCWQKHMLRATVAVRAGERQRLSVQFFQPERLDGTPPPAYETTEIDRRLQTTVRWWREWTAQGGLTGPDIPAVTRSAIVLKALTHAPTGAIIAAPTTSLPESAGGERNWDYRYSWIRDSCFSLRALGELGYTKEADGFRRFVERSAAGSAEELQIMYGVGGERWLPEWCPPGLSGYRNARPVRIGNAAAEQLQLDMYGALLDLAWRWHRLGQDPDDDYWAFLVDLIATTAQRWSEPDQGIWEMRGAPQHFTHSKVMCWRALDCGSRLALALQRDCPVARWQQVREEIRAAIETQGYDHQRGVFVQAFGSSALDASVLLLPSVEFLAFDDPRMLRTVRAIQQELSEDGLIVRYRAADDLQGHEGAFLACTFWLVECLAHQGRKAESRALFDRAVAVANDVGLFAEEYDVRANEMCGNFPQGLTHLSHIIAAVALGDSVE